MRVLRKKNKVSLRAAAKTMKISAPYLSDLELGRRIWDDAKIEAFKKAIQ